MTRNFAMAVVVIICATNAVAATFVVPTDADLVKKSGAVITGVVEGSYTQEVNGTIETTYEIRAERALKGAARPHELIRVVAMGGIVGERGVLVPGEAHYRQGERVLVFLTRDERGRWRTTDLTLGRFVFRTSTKGERLLVRDMEDVVAWDGAGRPHQENVRREAEFLHFVEERAKGRPAVDDYFVSASEVTLEPEPTYAVQAEATAYPAATYTSFVNNQPVRWPNISAGVPVYKRSDQNIAGAADGGVSVIQAALAAWTNECGSNINLSYAGQIAKASANHDGTNVVEFNDPQGRISGSWSGSGGTIGIAFLSFAGSHTFAGQTWLNITDMDVVFQDGYTASNAAFPTAMTHEVGHGLGWRHSNQNHATGGACNSAVEECTSAAIMNSSVNSSYGYTLQPWDINAAQSVYPGGTCTTCTAPSITSHPASTTITAGQSTTLSVSATGTGPLSYQWYLGGAGDTSQPISGATGSTHTVSPSASTQYWVRVTNACGAVNSNAAMVTVQQPTCNAPAITTQPTSRTISAGASTTLSVAASGSGLSYQWYIGSPGDTSKPVSGATASSVTVTPAAPTSYWVRVTNACGSADSAIATVNVTVATPRVAMRSDFNGDGRSDILWRHTGGTTYAYLMAGLTIIGQGTIDVRPDPWQVAGTGDFNGDGRADILWRNGTTGENYIYFMNGIAKIGEGRVSILSDTSWRVAGIGDFNGDGRSDILWRNLGNGLTVIYLMNGLTITASASVGTITDQGWQVAGVADFNGDGRADILWRHRPGGTNYLYMMNGTTIIAQGTINVVADMSWDIATVGDFSGDGRADIFWRHTGGTNYIYLMNGLTIVSQGTLDTRSDHWRVAASGDYNGDGVYDILWRNSVTGENYMYFLSGIAKVGEGTVNVVGDTSWRIVA